MASARMQYDSEHDVLYIRFDRAEIWSSHPVSGDDFVILNVDRGGGVVGLQLLDVGEMSAARWREHFHTGEIPELLFSAVEIWLREKDPPAGRSSSSGIKSKPPISDGDARR